MAGYSLAEDATLSFLHPLRVMDDILLYFEKTNEAPNPRHQACLESERAAIGTKILQIEETVARLIIQRNGLQTQRQRYTSALSPLRRCPNEVIAEIFTQFPASDHQSLFNISHVCHSWREVILGIPTLWTDIDIPSQDVQPTVEATLARIEHHIRHARGRPLSFGIDAIPRHLAKPILRKTFAATAVDQPTFPRWRDITIPANDNLFEDILLVLDHYKTPDADPSTLTSFRIAFNIGVDLFWGSDNLNLLDFRPLTSLRTFSWEIQNAGLLDRVLVNWGILTSLSLHTRLTSVSWFTILAQCHALESLRIFPSEQEEGIADGDVITMGNLRDLDIVSWYGCPVNIIERLSCPVVESLKFNFNSDEILLPMVYRFLERSKTDRLRDFHCTEELLFALLDRIGIPPPGFPCLVSLTLDREHYLEHDLNIFDFLTRELEDGFDEFPHLERLEIMDHSSSFRPAELESCFMMIHSRLQVSPAQAALGWRALQRIAVEGADDLELEEQNPFKVLSRFHEQGLLVGLL